MLAILLQAATMPPAGPTAWQLVVAVGGAASFMVLLVTFGMAYGKLTTRLEGVEAKQRDDDAKNAKHAMVEVMFAAIENRVASMGVDISRRLDRIEKHFDHQEKP